MIINWYGEGCFKVQTGGLTLITDPFDSSIGLTPPRGKNNILLKTLTPWPLKSDEAKNEEEKEVRGAGEYEIQGITIQGFSLPKDSSDKFLKTAYKVTAENISLGFLGHLSEELPTEALEGLKDSDILFIPAGGKPFLDSEKAAKLIKQLEPKMVVGSFFKVPKLKRKAGDWKDLAEEIGQKPEILDKLSVRKKDLAEQKKTSMAVLKL